MTTIPPVGLGLWKIDPEDVASAISSAIAAGYRHLDGACDYGNEAACGAALKNVLASGMCRREDVWVTSKLWNTFHRPEHVRSALERSLRDWQLDYFDLYLVHFPIPLAYVPIEKRYPPGWFYEPDAAVPRMVSDQVRISETWSAMEELVDAGLVRSIGVSNFGVSLIRDLYSAMRIRPAVLQVESHPYLVQEKLLRYCRARTDRLHCSHRWEQARMCR
ncbi:MAG: aldo/keto reductase [Pirellulales bacterium]